MKWFHLNPVRATLGILLMSTLPAWAAKPAAPLMSVPQPVRDLYYGDALFYFYQDDYFQSLIHLDAATSLGRVPNHQTEAELIKGALYLSLGEHVEAGRIFQSLLNDNVSLEVRNRAWFYLAKLWYQRGYLSESERALKSIQGELGAALDTERHMLFAQVLMNQGRFDEAITTLQALDHPGNPRVSDNWLAYARFNLGVALVRQDRVSEAATLLDRVGQLNAHNEKLSEELLALRDKANVALGFTLMKAGRTAEAEAVLQRVRLNGPQSNKALLGLGWAQSSAGKFTEALAPWLELKQRDVLDAAVQEAYLAIPYAYAQLKAEGEAAQYYNFAIDSFNQESARLDQSIAAIRDGSLLTTVLANDSPDQSGWYWQLRNLTDAPETRYLYDLLASNAFQEALKNYRDLKMMQTNLQRWAQSMSAFQDMVDTRRLAFTQRSESMRKALDNVDMESLEAKTLELEAHLNAVEKGEDIVALATSAQQTNWRRVTALREALEHTDAGDASVVEMQDKTRLLRGVLWWDMNANYKARLWRQKKELRELTAATKEARRRHTLVNRARNNVPAHNDEFAARVNALTPRVQALLDRCLSTGTAQSTFLAQLAIQQLEQQKQRLAQYSLQAQFALASIYDHASGTGNAPSPSVPEPAATGAAP